MGVPVVGSEAIDCLPRRFQAKADDVGDIARVAEYLIKSPQVVEDARCALRRYVRAGLQRWRDFAGARVCSETQPQSDGA
jgi:hypothetical protein